MEEIKPINKIVCTGLYPYDFACAYEQVFGIEIKVSTDTENLCMLIEDKWEERDSDLPEDYTCNVYHDGGVFTHTTISGRHIVYDMPNKTLTIDFDGYSTTFAYKWLSILAPLLQPEKWRGIGGGNVGFNGGIIEPLKIEVAYNEEV